MKKFLSVCLMFGTTLTWGEVIKSPIHSIKVGTENADSLIRFENGRVAFLSSHEKLLSDQLQESAERGDVVEVRIDDNQSLLSVQTVEEHSEQLKTFSLAEETVPVTYEATIVSGLAEATKIFNRLNKNWVRSSECTNRAHVWAHEEFTAHNLKSMKAFVFFTNSYIIRNRFKWWFHVAPMLKVREGGKIQHRVLDAMFNHGPVTVKEWINNFVFSKRDCKLDGKFHEYDRSADQTQDCYYFETPMYYWTPTDINNEELQNVHKREFFQGEVRAAYSEAF